MDIPHKFETFYLSNTHHHHLTLPQLACWLLLPQHGHYGQEIQTVSKILEASWSTWGGDAPTLFHLQGHQDGRGRCERNNASLYSAGNTELLQTLSCMHIFIFILKT